MGTFSRMRYVIAANVNSLLEKAEDPEKLLRALIREMEDASEDARLASADLLAEQAHLERLQQRLQQEIGEWTERAEKAVATQRDELARTALKTRAELEQALRSAGQEATSLEERITQLGFDMATLKGKLSDAKSRLKDISSRQAPGSAGARTEAVSPGERKIRRAMGRFERLQSQVERLEARVHSYELGGEARPVWEDTGAPTDPVIEAELEKMKSRITAS